MSGRKIAVLVAGIGVFFAAGIWWRTNQAVKLSQQQISLESQIRFTLNPWNRTSSAGYEPVSAASAFLDAASYQGKLYVASSNALLEYSAEQGTPAKIFRCGLDLPASPISALATGPALDGTGEWLYVATEGEGILIFDGQSFTHLRPELPCGSEVKVNCPARK